MRSLVVAVLVPCLALATPSTPAGEIYSLVRAHVTHVAREASDDRLLLTSDALVALGTSGFQLGNLERSLATTVNDGWNRVSRELGKPTVGFDPAGGFAWFQLPSDARFAHRGEENPVVPYETDERIGGLAVRDGTTWRLAALAYSDVASDKELLTRRTNQVSSVPASAKLEGDAALAKTVLGWFTTGFAPHMASAKVVVASGASPSEFGKGKDAATLVKGWDKRKLAVETLDARTYANGKAAAVRATVVIPSKQGKGGTTLGVLVILVREGDAWRWVSVQYSV